MNSTIENIKDCTVSGNLNAVIEQIDIAISENIEPDVIIQQGLIEAMNVVGDKFKNNEIFVPEMLIAARAMKKGLEKLRPLMVGKEVKTIGTVLIGTVKGDLHDIGKNLVSTMLEGSGFKVIDLGVDVSVEKFVLAAKEHNPNFIGMSCLLTTTMATMREAVHNIKTNLELKNTRVIIGGAPITQKFSEDIGADAYAENAAVAVDKLKQMMA